MKDGPGGLACRVDRLRGYLAMKCFQGIGLEMRCTLARYEAKYVYQLILSFFFALKLCYTQTLISQIAGR